MLLQSQSKTRSATLKSAPNKSRNLSELPPLINLSFRQAENTFIQKPNLALNNFLHHSKNLSFDCTQLPNFQIETLNDLCNQLIKGQAELKERLEKQESIIENLMKQRNESKTKIVSQENFITKRTESTPRRIPGISPRNSEESGFFTFRPSETIAKKSKFPREIFSRKLRVRPQ